MRRRIGMHRAHGTKGAKNAPISMLTNVSNVGGRSRKQQRLGEVIRAPTRHCDARVTACFITFSSHMSMIAWPSPAKRGSHDSL